MRLPKIHGVVSVILILAQLVLPLSAQAGDPIDWNSAPTIRDRMQECALFLSLTQKDPDGKWRLNDSIGVRLSSRLERQSIRESLQAAIAEKGIEEVQKGKIYATGVEMRDHRSKRNEVFEIASELGLKLRRNQVVVMSVPSKVVELLSFRALVSVWEKLRYWAPSLSRHFQKPRWDEAFHKIFSTIPVEIPTLIMVYRDLAPADAHVVAAIHTTILFSYYLYTKTVNNWMQQPGMKNAVPMLLKQLAMSTPFVVNFNVMYNMDKIRAFAGANGIQATLAEFPEQVATFGATQGLTVALQTIFYTVLMGKRIGPWIDSKSDPRQSVSVRSAQAWVTAPFLAADSFFIAMASSGKDPLWSLDLPYGTFSINPGHLLLAGLTAGSAVIAKPYILDPFLRFWMWGEDHVGPKWRRVKAGALDFTKNSVRFFSNLVGIDVSRLFKETVESNAKDDAKESDEEGGQTPPTSGI